MDRGGRPPPKRMPRRPPAIDGVEPPTRPSSTGPPPTTRDSTGPPPTRPGSTMTPPTRPGSTEPPPTRPNSSTGPPTRPNCSTGPPAQPGPATAPSSNQAAAEVWPWVWNDPACWPNEHFWPSGDVWPQEEGWRMPMDGWWFPAYPNEPWYWQGCWEDEWRDWEDPSLYREQDAPRSGMRKMMNYEITIILILQYEYK